MTGPNKKALAGTVVCDFSWVGAGPISTNILGQCGAEVIKIESRNRPDLLRNDPPFKNGVSGGLERSGYFASRNPNKKCISLDMSKAGAREVAVRLISKSDIIINNFRTGQMEKWKLGYEDVKKIRSDIIYVTMSLQGNSGPHSSYMGFGLNLNALVGLTHLAAVPGGLPFGTGTNYTDHVMVPAHTVFGIMAALLHREMTGEGQIVEIPQIQAAICMKPTDAVMYAANAEILEPQGLRDREGAPHGVYTTLGHRSWIGIGIFNDEQWNGLKKVMGNPFWAEDEKYRSGEGRKANEAEIDGFIEGWTRWKYADSLMKELLENGVPAGVVNDARGVIENVHLRERDYWVYLEHPVMGISLYNRAPLVFSETAVEMKTPAPVLGEHTEDVLSNFLGYSSAEIVRMQSEGILT